MSSPRSGFPEHPLVRLPLAVFRNVRYMTTHVVGTASEIFAYGTAIKLDE
jgi:hypothetical protein